MLTLLLPDTTLALNSTTLAILGGIVPPPSSVPPYFNTTPLIQLYSITANKWLNPVAPLPVALNHPNAAVVDGQVYLLGGLADTCDGVWRGTGTSWVYDPASNEWSRLPGMSDIDTPRGSAAVGVDAHTGVVYLAGGMTQLPLVEDDPLGQDSVDTVSAFDTRRGEWVVLPELARQMPGRRDHAGATVVDRVLYVLGGRDRGQENVRGEVFALDLKDLEKGWVTKKGRMPTPRGGVCSGTIGGKVYLFGGEGNLAEGSDGVFDQVEAYDIKMDTWERLRPMKVPRHGTYAATVDGGIYIPGGGIKLGGAPVDTFDVFYP